MPQLKDTLPMGQSIWLDHIDRSFMAAGRLQALIDDGLRGLTSNPSIFEKAIGDGDAYDGPLRQLVDQDTSIMQIYETLVISDIQQAADLLRPVYDNSDGRDGFVSLEASPDVAYDTQATLTQVRNLFDKVDRPNVMIKVPATAAGIPAIATLIGEGINVNVTLMFSQTHYDAVADAYIRGLERLAANDGDLAGVASVASFFVSRVDTAVDTRLQALDDKRVPVLLGKAGIANARLVYTRYLNRFCGERWQRLAARGARPQRILFGSTSVKNPDYPELMYVEALMGSNTVNTLPPATIRAFQQHGRVTADLTSDLEVARRELNEIAALGIDLEAITQQLQDDGVDQFTEAYEDLLQSIADKCERFEARQPA